MDIFSFDISTSHLIQLLVALAAGVLVFALSQTSLQRHLLKILIVIIPFQFVTSIYGTFNMVLTYLLGAGMFLNQSRRETAGRRWPLIWPFILIGVSFLLSWIQAPAIFRNQNLFYLIMIGSNVVLFYLCYNFISNEKDVHAFFKLLLVCNVLVILYCAVQLLVGFGQYEFLGIKEFSFQANRLDRRLVGPFNAAGITAEYFVIQCILIVYYVMVSGRYRKTGIALLFLNIAALIGTGNRGGFISLLLSFLLFIVVYRKRLGVAKTLALGLMAATFLTVASYVMVTYTDFNVLYERISGTRMHGITPDTRIGWPLVIEKILEKPILGHGPCLVTLEEFRKSADHEVFPKSEIGFYPHNFYLHILYTTGMVGLVAFSIWGIRYLAILKNSAYEQNGSFMSGLPRLGILIFFVFLFDQLKVEVLRSYFLDYQHYLAALFGMFCGLQKLSQRTEQGHG